MEGQGQQEGRGGLPGDDAGMRVSQPGREPGESQARALQAQRQHMQMPRGKTTCHLRNREEATKAGEEAAKGQGPPSSRQVTLSPLVLLLGSDGLTPPSDRNCHTVFFWAGHLTCLSLSFPICKMRDSVVIPPSRAIMRIRCDDTHKIPQGQPVAGI